MFRQEFKLFLFVFQDVQKHQGFRRTEAEAFPARAVNLQAPLADRNALAFRGFFHLRLLGMPSYPIEMIATKG